MTVFWRFGDNVHGFSNSVRTLLKTRTSDPLLDNVGLYLQSSRSPSLSQGFQGRFYFFCCISSPEVTITVKSYVFYPCTLIFFQCKYCQINPCFGNLCTLPHLASAHGWAWWCRLPSLTFLFSKCWWGFPASVPLLMFHTVRAFLFSFLGGFFHLVFKYSCYIMAQKCLAPRNVLGVWSRKRSPWPMFFLPPDFLLVSFSPAVTAPTQRRLRVKSINYGISLSLCTFSPRASPPKVEKSSPCVKVWGWPL